jgi:hypothetical protein
VQALLYAAERVKDWGFFVAMAKKYGMSADFCDLIPDLRGAAAAVDPAL